MEEEITRTPSHCLRRLYQSQAVAWGVERARPQSSEGVEALGRLNGLLLALAVAEADWRFWRGVDLAQSLPYI